MTIVALVAGATFLGIGIASNRLGPDRPGRQCDLDLD